MWGFQAKLNISNPLQKKDRPPKKSLFFMGYPDHAKGYQFFDFERGAIGVYRCENFIA